MLATVTSKSVRERWRGYLIGAVTMALMLWAGMAVYRSIDLSIYASLPEVFLSMMGIPENADVAALAYGAIYSSYGALTLAALSLSLGSASIAGEERDGTIGLLLANPKSRTHVLVSKAAAMVALSGFGALIMWVAAVVVPRSVDVSVAGMHPGALVAHMCVNALFYGFLALAVGAWTGKASFASSVSVTVMVLSFLAAGLFPVIERLADFARVSPWHYYDSSHPVNNGVDWGHLSVLIAGIAVMGVLAVVGINRRDLRSQSVGETIFDRLRSNRYTTRIIERLAGSARVSRIWVKTASEHQGLVIITAYVMFLVMGVMMGPLYTWMDQAVLAFADQLPDVLIALVGGGDMSTPEGYFEAETFSMTAPIAVMVVTISIGAKALAGEESRRTMGLLLANPIPRSKVVLEKSLALVVTAAIVGFATFAGVALGSVAGGLGMSIANIAAISLLVTLLGVAFGCVALALGAGTGRTRFAAYGTSGFALVMYLLNSFLPLSDSLAGYAKWTPFHYYLASDPLNNGMDWGGGAVLAGLAIALVGLSVMLFQRRDLRQTG